MEMRSSQESLEALSEREDIGCPASFRLRFRTVAVYAVNQLADSREDLIADRLGEQSEITSGDALVSALTHEHSFVAHRHTLDIRQVDHGLIHGHPPYDRCSLATDEHRGLVGQHAGIPIRVADWKDSYHRRLVGQIAAPIAYALSLIHISEPTRLGMISYAVFCLKKKKNTDNHHM